MRYLMLLMLGAMSSGCLLELMTTTAIQGELASQSATQGQQAIHHAQDMKGKTELDQAIKMFHFDQGHYPDVLDELVPRYLAAVPMRGNGQPYNYDPRTGYVSTQGQAYTPTQGGAVTMTAQDSQNLQALRGAIYSYWQATGRYPESLSVLSPLYIESVPSMSSGGAYLYDPTTGAVNHPQELRAPSQGQRNNSREEPKMIHENYSDNQLETLVDLGF